MACAVRKDIYNLKEFFNIILLPDVFSTKLKEQMKFIRDTKVLAFKRPHGNMTETGSKGLKGNHIICQFLAETGGF